MKPRINLLDSFDQQLKVVVKESLSVQDILEQLALKETDPALYVALRHEFRVFKQVLETLRDSIQLTNAISALSSSQKDFIDLFDHHYTLVRNIFDSLFAHEITSRHLVQEQVRLALMTRDTLRFFLEDLRAMQKKLHQKEKEVDSFEREVEGTYNAVEGCIRACEEACVAKLRAPSYSKTAAAVLTKSGTFVVARNELGEVQKSLRPLHAEMKIATMEDLSGKMLCLSDQPCFHQETIRLTKGTFDSRELEGTCIKTNYSPGKKKFKPFTITISQSQGTRVVKTTQWFKEAAREVEYVVAYRMRTINPRIVVIEEKFENTWLPVEELELVSTRMVIRRTGCAVMIAHTRPKQVFYALSEERVGIYYKGSKSYLRNRGVPNEEVSHEGLNALALALKHIIKKNVLKQCLSLIDQLRSLLFSIGIITDVEYTQYIMRRYLQEGGKYYSDPRRTIMAIDDWQLASVRDSSVPLLRRNSSRFRLQRFNRNIASDLLAA